MIQRNIEDVFGKLTGRWICTDAESVNAGDEVTLVNSNCEFEFDNVFGVFQTDLLHYFLVDLELVKTDYTNYKRSKSNNGGCYAYATCKVVKVYDKSY